MITLSETYSRDVGPHGMGYFDIIAADLTELTNFFSANKKAIDRNMLSEEEVDALRINLKSAKREIAETLVYRYNLSLIGQEVQADKKLFLDHFKMEAVKAVIYATDHIPLEMTIDQYAGLVMKAYEEFGPGDLFSERIMNASGAKTPKHWIAVGMQVQLFLTLLDIPENLTNHSDDNDLD